MRYFMAIVIGLFLLSVAFAEDVKPAKVAEKDLRKQESIIKGQVRTKDGYGVWTKDNYPVMIKNRKAKSDEDFSK